MKKRIVAMLIAGVLGASMLSGCGNEDKSSEQTKTEEKKSEKEETKEKEAEEEKADEKEAEEPAEEEFDVIEGPTDNTDIPAPIDIDMSDFYSLVISYPDNYYFSFADMDTKHDALLITSPDFVFDNGDGVMAATEAQIYGFDSTGSIKDYGCVAGGGTATPLATKDGELYYGGHADMNRMHIDEATSSLIVDQGEYFDDYEDAIVISFLTVEEGKGMFQEYDDFDGPSDFIQYQSGQLEFKDFDEIISFLTKGQGYTYLKVPGLDDELLVLAEEVNPADKTATSVTVYRTTDKGVIQLGLIPGMDNPVRFEEGIFYVGTEHSYEADFLGRDGNGIMVKDYVYEDISGDTPVYGGFLRETNDYDHDQEFTGGEAEFKALQAELPKKPVIEFTIVE